MILYCIGGKTSCTILMRDVKWILWVGFFKSIIREHRVVYILCNHGVYISLDQTLRSESYTLKTLAKNNAFAARLLLFNHHVDANFDFATTITQEEGSLYHQLGKNNPALIQSLSTR